jgi:hypothetical protein
MLDYLTDSDEWIKPIQDAIIKKRIAWKSPTSIFFNLDDGLIVKVPNNFSPRYHALHEFIILCRLSMANDARLIVPDVITSAHLGTNHQMHEMGLESFTYGTRLEPETYNIAGIVMRKFDGKPLSELSKDKIYPYKKSLLELVDALIEHNVQKHDLKQEEIFCLNNATSVGICDFNFTRTGEAASYRERYMKVIGFPKG